VHPLCAALAPALSLFATNTAELPPGAATRTLLVLPFVAALLVAGLSALMPKDQRLRRGAVAATFVLLLSYAYSPLQPFLATWMTLLLGEVAVSQAHLWELPLFAAIVLGIVVLVRRVQVDNLSRALAVGGVALLLQALWQLRPTAATEIRPLGAGAVADDRTSRPAPAPPSATSTAPDLYVIVLDAYGRQDTLQALYGLDNEPFLRALESRGFTVLRRARANYLQTALALGAALNLDYLPQQVAPNDPNARIDLMTPRINENRIAALLRTRDYRFVCIPTGAALASAASADLLMEPVGVPPATGLNAFEGLLIDRTPLSAIPRDDRTLFDLHRHQIRTAFDRLVEASRLPYPKFVFAHILAPHPPFVFGPNGEAVQIAGRPFSIGDATDFTRTGSADQYRQRYPDQVRYINARLLETIDALRKPESRPAAIVLMGDHGPRLRTDWRSLQGTDVTEALTNLQAVLLPGGATSIPQDATPINTLRAVLTRLQGFDLKPLPDHSYYSTLRTPYVFTDVTDRLNRP
jgi:hypothetical protein